MQGMTDTCDTCTEYVMRTAHTLAERDNTHTHTHTHVHPTCLSQSCYPLCTKQRKCEKYWQETTEEKLRPGRDLVVELVNVEKYDEYEIRDFVVIKEVSLVSSPHVCMVHTLWIS